MSGILVSAVGLLRGEQSAAVLSWRAILLVIVCFGPIYGAVMGSYGFDSSERVLQVVYSAVKVPLLLSVSTVICVPGYFVISTVMGLREDFGRAFGAILAGQAVMSVTLASLAPVTRVFYFSQNDYAASLLFNGLMFAIATGTAQLVMRRMARPLVRKNPRHRFAFWVWGVMYVFVGIQMGWTLRPFVGSPGAFPTFFREDPFTNAYVEVASIVRRAIAGAGAGVGR